jgi:hypothetical protein
MRKGQGIDLCLFRFTGDSIWRCNQTDSKMIPKSYQAESEFNGGFS